jgi:hypothetical protein
VGFGEGFSGESGLGEGFVLGIGEDAHGNVGDGLRLWATVCARWSGARSVRLGTEGCEFWKNSATLAGEGFMLFVFECCHGQRRLRLLSYC